MAILLALDPSRHNTAAIALAAELSVALREPVIAVAVVVVAAGVPSPLRIGMTDDAFVALLSSDAVAKAVDALGDTLAESVTVRARSVRAGLLDVIQERRPTHLVLGSSIQGELGRVAIGDTAQALLHSAQVPVHLAPVGYAPGVDPHPIRRVTAAFGPGDDSVQALRYAAALADQLDSMFRAATFWVRPTGGPTPFGNTAAYAADLSAQWHQQMTDSLDAAARGLSELALPTRWLDKVFGDGATWRSAIDELDWAAGDLLIVGSRGRKPGIRSVFLGSHAAEILRNCPVPVTVLPA